MKTEVITKKEIIIALLVSSIMLIYGIAQLHKVVSTSDYTATIETVSNHRRKWGIRWGNIKNDHFSYAGIGRSDRRADHHCCHKPVRPA